MEIGQEKDLAKKMQQGYLEYVHGHSGDILTVTKRMAWKGLLTEGLTDKRLNQISHRRAPVDEVFALTERYKNRYRGWSVKHFYSWYSRDGGKRSSTWVKKR